MSMGTCVNHLLEMMSTTLHKNVHKRKLMSTEGRMIIQQLTIEDDESPVGCIDNMDPMAKLER